MTKSRNIVKMHWEPWEDAILRSLWGKIPPKDIPLNHLTESQIRHRAADLKLSAGRAWTSEEERYFRAAYGVLAAESIAYRIKRPLSTVYQKAYKLGLAKKGTPVYVKFERFPSEYIERYLSGEPVEKLAKDLRTTPVTFRKFLKASGVPIRTVADECRKRLPKMYEINKKLRADPNWRKKLSAKMQGIDLRDWKKFSHPRRISSTLAWRKWRRLVYERDQFRCILCNRTRYELKQAGDHLEPHHIKMRIHHPELVFEVDNGVTLCHRCHRSISNYEKQYEEFFIEYVKQINFARGGSLSQ